MALLGGLTLSNVRRGVTMAATLGYWMGEPYAGKVDRAAGLEARRDAYRKIIAAAPEPPEPAADAAPITADAMKGLVDRGIYTKDKP